MSAQALHDFLRSRRSVRRFQLKSVPQPVVERIIETATWAPSAHNRQPWRFIVLSTADRKVSLANSMGEEFRRDLLSGELSPEEVERQVQRSYRRIVDAPVVIVLCLDSSELDDYPDSSRSRAEYTMGVQGVALSGGYMLLAAHAEGLGGVWVCAPLFAPRAVCHALSLPERWAPQGMLLLGYPERLPDPRPRRNISDVTQFI